MSLHEEFTRTQCSTQNLHFELPSTLVSVPKMHEDVISVLSQSLLFHMLHS